MQPVVDGYPVYGGGFATVRFAMMTLKRKTISDTVVRRAKQIGVAADYAIRRADTR